MKEGEGKKSGKDGFTSLGKSPKSRNQAMASSDGAMQYPSLHIGVEDFPAMKDMKLGEHGHAHIKFKINPKYGGIDVTHIKMHGGKGSAADKAEDKADGGKDEDKEAY